MSFDNSPIEALPVFLFGGYRKFNKGEYHIDRITTDNILILMFSGTLNFTEDGKDVSLSKNEYYIQKAGLLQEGKIPSDMPEYYFAHFTSDITDNLLGLPLKGDFSIDSLIHLTEHLNFLHLSPNSNNLEKQIYFLRILNDLIQYNALPQNSDLDKILSFIHKNISSDITLDSLANNANFSKDYIIKKFKALYNITPHQYIIKTRIEMAKNLLITSNQSLNYISSKCGFNDISTFHRSFLKETGITPANFRKMNLLQKNHNDTATAKKRNI